VTATTSPYVTAGWNYGNAFTFTPEGSVVTKYTPSNGTGGSGTAVSAYIAPAGGATVAAQSTSLVNSPIASACYACHDTSTAKGHMTSNGGAIYEARSTALLKSEGCLACHGQGKVEDVAVVHQ
jgi:OmcA/MtrC family decaheme c-type cytochrome